MSTRIIELPAGALDPKHPAMTIRVENGVWESKIRKRYEEPCEDHEGLSRMRTAEYTITFSKGAQAQVEDYLVRAAEVERVAATGLEAPVSLSSGAL